MGKLTDVNPILLISDNEHDSVVTSCYNQIMVVIVDNLSDEKF